MSESPQSPPGPAGPPAPMPWGAWGSPRPLPPEVRGLLGQFLGLPPDPVPAVPEDQVILAPSRLAAPALAGLRQAAGQDGVHTGRAERLRHAGGKSTTDLLRGRAADAGSAPDAVVTPASHEDVLAILAAAEQHRIAETSRDAFQERLRQSGYGDITTEIAQAGPFYYAEEYHQQYLEKNPWGYCGLGGTGVSCPAGIGASSAAATPRQAAPATASSS